MIRPSTGTVRSVCPSVVYSPARQYRRGQPTCRTCQRLRQWYRPRPRARAPAHEVPTKPPAPALAPTHPRRAHDHVAGSGGGRGGGRAVGGMHGDLREREAIEQACPCVSNDDKAHTGRLRVRRPGAYRCQWHTRSVKAKCTTLELVRAQADACMV